MPSHPACRRGRRWRRCRPRGARCIGYRPKQLCRLGLALLERPRAPVLAFELKQAEGVEEDLVVVGAAAKLMDHGHAGVVAPHRLAVERSRCGPQPGQRLAGARVVPTIGEVSVSEYGGHSAIDAQHGGMGGGMPARRATLVSRLGSMKAHDPARMHVRTDADSPRVTPN
jgi:hypothetical protein